MSSKEIISNITQTARQVLPDGASLILFGSRARGDASFDSDWDLLLLLNQDQIASLDFDTYAYPFVSQGWRWGEYFSVKVYTYKEWERRKGTPFYKNVETDGIKLWEN